MADTSPIDTSGDSPRIRIGALVATLSGTVIYGWYVGFVDFVGTAGSGITGSISTLESWLSGQLIPSTIGIGTGSISTLVASNAEFLDSLGSFAIVGAAVEMIVILWLLNRGVGAALGVVKGLMSS